MVSLFPILVLLVLVTLVGLGLVILSSFLGPRLKQSKLMRSSYECGIEVQETEQTKIPVKFYLTAILFILFDIEIIFMYPWAVTYTDFIDKGHGLYMLGAMGFFLFIFIFGLVWEIKSKALEWE